MITSGSRVLIGSNGEDMIVDRLNISDRIYNPFSHSYAEISDILSRTVKFEDIVQINQFLPVLLPKNSLADGKPNRDLYVSPAQKIFHTFKDQSSNYQTLTTKMASELRSPSMQGGWPQSLPMVKYFAIFCDTPQYMCVNGVTLTTFDPSYFDAEIRTKNHAGGETNVRHQPKQHEQS